MPYSPLSIPDDMHMMNPTLYLQVSRSRGARHEAWKAAVMGNVLPFLWKINECHVPLFC